MAVIEKIRQRSGLVIVIIGLALASFLLSDAISNNTGLFRSNDTTVGKIAGKEVDYRDFTNRVEKLTRAVEEQGQPVDESTSGMIREQIWNEYFQQWVIDKQYEELGLIVTNEELYDIVTNPVDFPQLMNAESFKNEQTGQFDKNKILNYLKQIQSSDQEEAKKQWEQWVRFENESLIPQTIQKKYNAMISKAVFVTDMEIEDEYFANNVTFETKIAGFNFNSVADTTVDVSEEEMRAYLKNHPEDYQQEASRKIEYITLDVFPSAADTAKVRDWATKTALAFKNTKNDTLFTENNGNGNRFDTTFKSRGSFPADIENEIFAAEPGTVVGPYYEAGQFNIYKVIGSKEDTVPYIRASQILIKPKGISKDDSLAAVTRASKIMAAVRAGADFAKTAKDSSQDYRSARNGGDLGWMKKGGASLPEAVERVLYSTSEGGIFMVRTHLGVHIVKATSNRSNKIVNVQVVSDDIQYSGDTENEVYTTAFDFASKSRNSEEFAKNAEEKGLNILISPDLKEGEMGLPGIENARDIIRWAFNDERSIGDISEVMTAGDKFIVAHLVSVKEKGTSNYEDVKDQLENDTRLEKKAEMLKERIKKAMDENKSVEQIAIAMGTIMNTAPNAQFSNPNIPFVGNDFRLIGAITGATESKMEGPLRTDNGVYMFEVIKINKTPFPEDMMADRMRIGQEKQDQAPGRAFQALKEAADIQDFRYKFF